MPEIMPDLIQCPDCQGAGAVAGIACGLNFGGVRTLPCFRCRGERSISAEQLAWMRQGEAMRLDRIRENCGGRERARMLGITPLELNAVEHGKVDPKEVLA